MSNDILNKALEIANNKIVSERHSYFQLKYFILGKEPTVQGALWQCITEIKSRISTIENIDFEVAELYDKINLINIKLKKIHKNLENEISELDSEEHYIHIRINERKKAKILKGLQELDNKKARTTEELQFFIDSFESLSKVEPVVPFDDYKAQTEYWGTKLKEELNWRLMFRLPLDSDLAKTILSLPDNTEVKTDIIQLINNIQENQKKLTQVSSK